MGCGGRQFVQLVKLVKFFEIVRFEQLLLVLVQLLDKQPEFQIVSVDVLFVLLLLQQQQL